MDLSISSLIVAFVGGILMFLAPCTLPLVPAFLASLVPSEQRAQHRELLIRTVLFILGFTVIFVLFGVLTGLIGTSVSAYKSVISQIGGFIIVAFGVSMLDVVAIPRLSKAIRVSDYIRLSNEKRSTSLFLGSLFALGWTPCAGPILASILLVASQSATVLSGGVLLLSFSLGLAIPFMLVGLLYAHVVHLISGYAQYARLIRWVSGLLLILLGIVILFGQSILMTHWGFALYSFFGYVPMCTYY